MSAKLKNKNEQNDWKKKYFLQIEMRFLKLYE